MASKDFGTFTIKHYPDGSPYVAFRNSANGEIYQTRRNGSGQVRSQQIRPRETAYNITRLEARIEAREKIGADVTVSLKGLEALRRAKPVQPTAPAP